MASSRRSGLHRTFGTTLQARRSAVDAALLAAVPLVLLAVFTLPSASRNAYVLHYTDPTVVTMYASHFVHKTPTHLAANLAGYAAVVPAAYLCCLLADRRRLFRVAFLSLLIALPVGLSGLNLLYFEQAVGYGFSGVLMGYFGLLALSLYVYVTGEAAPGLDASAAGADRHAPVAFFLGIVTICVAISSATRATRWIGVAALLSAALYLRYLPGVSGTVDRVRAWVAGSPPGFLELGAVGAILFFGYPFVAFPADPLQGGAVVNLYTHLLGYALGFISPYIFQVLPVTDGGSDRPSQTAG